MTDNLENPLPKLSEWVQHTPYIRRGFMPVFLVKIPDGTTKEECENIDRRIRTLNCIKALFKSE